ncbi:MAG TPA: hypothetical protein VJP77_06245, partial [Planctomycetota bacterium]|nr:hypothetical protein [Planctomycetota bacterium]
MLVWAGLLAAGMLFALGFGAPVELALPGDRAAAPHEVLRSAFAVAVPLSLFALLDTPAVIRVGAGRIDFSGLAVRSDVSDLPLSGLVVRRARAWWWLRVLRLEAGGRRLLLPTLAHGSERVEAALASFGVAVEGEQRGWSPERVEELLAGSHVPDVGEPDIARGTAVLP